MTNLQTGSGRQARPKTSADKMAIMGGVHLMLTPEKIERVMAGKETIIELGEAREFVLTIESGPQNRILELTPLFDPSRTSVVVGNSYQTDGADGTLRGLYDAIEFTLTESKTSNVGFTVTPAQARVLAAALTDYANAWAALDALGEERLPA